MILNKYTTNILYTRGKFVPHVWILDRIHTAAQATNQSLGVVFKKANNDHTRLTVI